MPFGRNAGVVVLAGSLLIAACGADAEPETSTVETTVETTMPPTSTTQSDSETGEVPMSDALEPAGELTGGNVGLSYAGETYPTELGGIIGLALTDLAERLGVEVSSINVVLVEEVTWSDASLGCPQPDMSYAQVVTDGLRIVLESQGVLYDYRSGGMADPEICEQTAEKEDTSAGQFDLTDEGEIVFVPSEKKDGEPTEGLNPPDE